MALLLKPTAASPSKPKPPARPTLAIVLSVGMSLAILDLILNLLVSGSVAYSTWSHLPAYLSATFIATTVTVLCVYVLLIPVVRSGHAGAIALCTGIVLLAVVCAGNLILPGDELVPSDWRYAVVLGVIVAAAACLAMRIYPAARRVCEETPTQNLSSAAMLVAVSMSLAFAAVWRYVTAGRWEWIGGSLLAMCAVGFIASIRRLGHPQPTTSRLVSGVLVTLSTAIVIGGLGVVVDPWAARGSIPANRPAGKRQVLLLTVDTLRADRLGCYGGSVPTPHIDTLATDGALFENAISPAPWTLPAFVSMMTGLYSNVHQATTHASRVPHGVTTLAERLADAGLRTAAIGDNPILAPESGMSQGFAEYRFFAGPESRASLGGRILHALYPRRFISTPRTDDLADMACDWLTRHAGEDFFLWLHFFDPHLPYAPPAEFRPDSVPPPGFTYEFDDLDAVRSGHVGTTADHRRWIEALYNAEVRYVDAAIGRVLEKLKSLGIYDELLIVFASDHGEEFWEHGGFEHGHSVYQELIHVPLIIKPNQRKDVPKAVTSTVSTAAITPTVLELAGIPFDSSDFSVAALAVDEPNAAAVHSGGQLYFEDREAVLWERNKYIVSPISGKRELYDLAADPMETASLAATHEELLDVARQQLQRCFEAAIELRDRLQIEAASAEVSPARLRQLQSLGYVD